MKFNRLVLSVLIFPACLLPCIRSNAQQVSDSANNTEAISQFRQTYFKEIGDNAQIYHGTKYIRYGQKVVGFPYFESDSMLYGVISYQGTLYPNRKLFYNLVSDELIIQNLAQGELINLSPEKTDSFTIYDHHFVKLTHVSPQMTAGYYDQLSYGEPSLYAKREKRLVTGAGNEEIKYIQYNSYFLKKGTAYLSVGDKKSLLAVFQDQADAVKKYIRSNKLNFKKNLEKSLVMTTIYYSQLKH